MSEQNHLRRQRATKRDALIALGVDPYGGRFPDITANAEVRAQSRELDLPDGQRSAIRRRVAGRIVLLRVMGKLAFMQERMLPVDEVEASAIAEALLRSAPATGYLTISNAQQWRLQYSRVIEKAGSVDGVERVG